MVIHKNFETISPVQDSLSHNSLASSLPYPLTSSTLIVPPVGCLRILHVELFCNPKLAPDKNTEEVTTSKSIGLRLDTKVILYDDWHLKCIYHLKTIFLVCQKNRQERNKLGQLFEPVASILVDFFPALGFG